MNIKYIFGFSIAFLLAGTSCKKNWLGEKQNISLIIPTTLQDFRLLINNTYLLAEEYGGLAMSSADEYYFTNAVYASQYPKGKLLYTWSANPLQTETSLFDWEKPYAQIYHCNLILEGLEKITPAMNEQEEYNDIKGGALCYRARAFHNLAQMFCKPYNPATAATDTGIHIRLTSDLRADFKKSTVKETYDRIISDIEQGVLLVKKVALAKNDIGKPAAFGLLARYYLSMSNYDKALAAADSCLKYHNTLLDFNQLSTVNIYPIPYLNNEIILNQTMRGVAISKLSVDTVLYKSYHVDDLRRSLFFKIRTDNTWRFYGQYNGNAIAMSGPTTAEMLLIKAECLARKNDVDGAMEALNTLLIKRFITNKFTPLTAASPDEALKIVLMERRKELLFRGLRWTDLRRLNMNPATAVTLKRSIDGKEYTLPPNDPRYTLKAPEYTNY